MVHTGPEEDVIGALSPAAPPSAPNDSPPLKRPHEPAQLLDAPDASLVSAEFVRKAAAWATAARPTTSIKHMKSSACAVIRPPATFDRNATSVTGRRTSPGPVAAHDHVSQMGVRARSHNPGLSARRPAPLWVLNTGLAAWRLVSGPDRCATQTGIERLHRHR
jgi:hypothetical protein